MSACGTGSEVADVGPHGAQALGMGQRALVAGGRLVGRRKVGIRGEHPIRSPAIAGGGTSPPVRTACASAQSATVRAIGPTVSKLAASG